jgi:hypothetical protein
MRYELKPLGVGGILDQAIRILKDRFVLFLLIMSCLQIPLTFVTGWISFLNTPTLSARPTPEEMQAVMNAQFSSGIILLPCILLNLFIATPITNAAIVYATANIYLGKPTSLGDAMRGAMSRLVPFIWTWFLVGLIVGLGMMACIVPGIIFLFRYFLATDIAVIEGVSGRAALRRSRDLMLSDRTKHYNTAFLLGLIIFFINLAIQQGSIHFIPQPLIATLVLAIAQGIGTAFALIAVVVFYFSCRCRAENFDLVQLANALVASPVELRESEVPR